MSRNLAPEIYRNIEAETADSRATLNSNRGDLLLVAMSVEAGDIIIYDLDLLPREAGVFIKDNLVLLAVL